MRMQSISAMVTMFDLSRPTILRRLRSAGVKPSSIEGRRRLYDMSKAGPALFSEVGR